MSVIHVNSVQEFDNTVEHGLACIDFFATWCRPCKMIAPQFEAMSAKYPQVKFLKVDVDIHKSLAGRYGIKAMPTFKVLGDGLVVGEIQGANLPAVEQLLIKNIRFAETLDRIPRHAKIVLHSMKTESVNGKTGVVMGFNPKSSRYAIEIDMGGKGKKKAALKPENLRQVLNFQVERPLEEILAKINISEDTQKALLESGWTWEKLRIADEKEREAAFHKLAIKPGHKSKLNRALAQNNTALSLKSVMDATAIWDESKEVYTLTTLGDSKGSQGNKMVNAVGLRLPKGCRVKVANLKNAPKFNGRIGKVFDYIKGRYVVGLTEKKAMLKPENLRVI